REQRLPAPDFIKCDVEGAELLVFRGASQLLNRADAPVLLFEINEQASRSYNFTVQSTTDFLVNLNAPHFHFFRVEPDGQLLHLDSRKVELPAVPLINVLAVPRARLDKLEAIKDLIR